MDKTMILATFIYPNKVDGFLEYLQTNFSITKDKVFCYKNLEDQSKVIMTFKIIIKQGEYLNIKELFPGSVPIHKKGTALYTINALNKLIDQTTGNLSGNTDHNSFKINWAEYQDKIILINGRNLGIFNIQRIF